MKVLNYKKWKLKRLKPILENKDIFYKDVFDFIKKYLNIKSKVNLIHREPIYNKDTNRTQIGGVGFPENGIYTIYINFDLNEEEFVRVLSHEMVHVKQIESGKLRDLGVDSFEWDGIEYNYSKYQDEFHTNTLPFEEEAFKLEKEISNKYLNINENKIYNNINNLYGEEKLEYYQIPFSLFEKGICIQGEDNYVLCFSNNFVYDYITDEDIRKGFEQDLTTIDISKDWSMISNNIFKFETAYTNKEKHILRICKLIKEIEENKKINPIMMYFDQKAYFHDIKNFIEDGNHRIRALQYLKYTYFPAYLYGDSSKYLIKYLEKNNNSINESYHEEESYFHHKKKKKTELKLNVK